MDSQNKRLQALSNFTKDVDYYYNDKGLMVLTEHYLRKRGYCCKNGCLHCPYKNISEQKRREHPENP